MKRLLAAIAVFLCLSGMALAVSPSEMLNDPVLEGRARDISAGLRCLVCQNQSIDDSDAELARDLRVLVRERLVAGDSDAEVEQFLVDRYGEYVLLNPRLGGHTILLWIAAPALLLVGLGTLFFALRRFRRQPASAALTSEEAQVLAELADDETKAR
jgi:cytochrome c-type biogenesis protein CcmH